MCATIGNKWGYECEHESRERLHYNLILRRTFRDIVAKCTFGSGQLATDAQSQRTENALLRASRVNICESFHRVISTGLRRMPPRDVPFARALFTRECFQSDRFNYRDSRPCAYRRVRARMTTLFFSPTRSMQSGIHRIMITEPESTEARRYRTKLLFAKRRESR